MTANREKRTRVAATTKGLSAEIARYEAMTSQQIDNELRGQGVNPQEMVEAVTKLVEEKLRKHRRRVHKTLVRRTAQELPANRTALLHTMPPCGLLRSGVCPLLGGSAKRHGRSPAILSFRCGPCASRPIHPDL
jgi:hypothetical protein